MVGFAWLFHNSFCLYYHLLFHLIFLVASSSSHPTAVLVTQPKHSRIIIRTLIFLGDLINTYRQCWKPEATQSHHDNPIYPIVRPP